MEGPQAHPAEEDEDDPDDEDSDIRMPSGGEEAEGACDEYHRQLDCDGPIGRREEDVDLASRPDLALAPSANDDSAMTAAMMS